MTNKNIKGWLISGHNFDQYTIDFDENHYHSGNKSVKIGYKNTLLEENFATVMQQVSAKNFLNTRIRVSAYLKSKDIEGWGGIWVRIDGKNCDQLKFDTMQNRPLRGTNDWNYYSSVLDVPKEAEVLNFGFLLQGTGALWADDFCIEVVTDDINTTDFACTYPTEPQNLSFTE